MPHALKERLLALMDTKHHWAWPRFEAPGLTREQLLVHFRHEYHTYVRDFPVLLARVLALGPPPEVRRALAENVYEESTGKLSFGVSHPELFLELMDGLHIDRAAVEAEGGHWLPAAETYRRFLWQATGAQPWPVAAAVITLFVEGSRHERAELAGTRARAPIEAHPWAVHYGCPVKNLRLMQAHALVEGDHRDDGWRSILEHVPDEGPLAERVVGAVERALQLWLRYRDSVAEAMGLSPSG
ncbi:MAG: iron-containing redox enzyme family protein [Myxococcales bacterium]|nr:iron-containing redox enzyme family protein [Myxococcales bacterium]